MAEQIPREKWVPEIPADFPDPDRPFGYPDGLFKSEEELQAAMDEVDREEFPAVPEEDLR